jgi:hypothetical protein
MTELTQTSFIETVNRLTELWPKYKLGGKADKRNPVHNLVLNDIPGILKSWAPEFDQYIFKGSEGEGNLTKTPWFAVLNPDITETARKGYYIVYLFDEDLSKLILAIGFGVTQFENRYGGGKKIYPALNSAVDNMRMNSSYLMDSVLITSGSRTNTEVLSLTNTGDKRLSEYEKCAIYALSYDLQKLPNDDLMKSDFLEYLNLYSQMSESLLIADDDAYVLESNTPVAQTDEVAEKEFTPRAPKKLRTSKNNSSARERRFSKKADKIGKKGEDWVFEYEKRKLIKLGKSDLAEKVIWHRNHAIDRTPGWDITSYDANGEQIFIEVKSTTGETLNEIILTVKEWQKATEDSLCDKYLIYLVTNVLAQPNLEIIRNPSSYVQAKKLEISVESYSLSLHGK